MGTRYLRDEVAFYHSTFLFWYTEIPIISLVVSQQPMHKKQTCEKFDSIQNCKKKAKHDEQQQQKVWVNVFHQMPLVRKRRHFARSLSQIICVCCVWKTTSSLKLHYSIGCRFQHRYNSPEFLPLIDNSE